MVYIEASPRNKAYFGSMKQLREVEVLLHPPDTEQNEDYPTPSPVI